MDSVVTWYIYFVGGERLTVHTNSKTYSLLAQRLWEGDTSGFVNVNGYTGSEEISYNINPDNVLYTARVY